MGRLPEVIATVRRRRRRTTEEKVAILDAAFRRGGSVAAAADRSEVSRALIYLWCSQALRRDAGRHLERGRGRRVCPGHARRRGSRRSNIP